MWYHKIVESHSESLDTWSTTTDGNARSQTVCDFLNKLKCRFYAPLASLRWYSVILRWTQMTPWLPSADNLLSRVKWVKTKRFPTHTLRDNYYFDKKYKYFYLDQNLAEWAVMDGDGQNRHENQSPGPITRPRRSPGSDDAVVSQSGIYAHRYPRMDEGYYRRLGTFWNYPQGRFWKINLTH